MKEVLVLTIGVVGVLLFIPVVGALLDMAAAAATTALPNLIVLWFVVAILLGLIRSLFH